MFNRKSKTAKTAVTPEARALSKINDMVSVSVVCAFIFVMVVATVAVGFWFKSAWSMDDGTRSAPWALTGIVTAIWGAGILFIAWLTSDWIGRCRRTIVEDITGNSQHLQQEIKQIKRENEALEANAKQAIASAQQCRKVLEMSDDEKDKEIAALVGQINSYKQLERRPSQRF